MLILLRVVSYFENASLVLNAGSQRAQRQRSDHLPFQHALVTTHPGASPSSEITLSRSSRAYLASCYRDRKGDQISSSRLYACSPSTGGKEGGMSERTSLSLRTSHHVLPCTPAPTVLSRRERIRPRLTLLWDARSSVERVE